MAPVIRSGRSDLETNKQEVSPREPPHRQPRAGHREVFNCASLSGDHLAKCSDLRPPGLLVTGPRRSRKQTPPQRVNASLGLRKDPDTTRPGPDPGPETWTGPWTGPPPLGGLVTLLVPLFPRRTDDERLIVTGRTLTDRQTETTRASGGVARRSLAASASRRLIVSTDYLNVRFQFDATFRARNTRLCVRDDFLEAKPPN
ncbi:hypothetical protein EYF80_040481 [Liparis tanakae]|uniref:Uncharacterized protein n=1 Tax=Liparis tanakae TaxID=230148 RepID=A0A4Z2G6X7_9TELE|nr:hypothetical protein EYF80_040481 [Liparis tanakae]